MYGITRAAEVSMGPPYGRLYSFGEFAVMVVRLSAENSGRSHVYLKMLRAGSLVTSDATQIGKMNMVSPDGRGSPSRLPHYVQFESHQNKK